MTKNWILLEKLISGIEIIRGSFILLYTILSINADYEAADSLMNISDQLFLQYAMKYHFFLIISILSIYAGISLLRSKKTGWVTSIIISFTYLIIYLNSLLKYIEVSAFGGFLFLLFLTISILLLSDPFRNKYKPTDKNWFVIAAATIYIIFYHMINFSSF